jgi:Xaa-Pro aminopeptidase
MACLILWSMPVVLAGVPHTNRTLYHRIQFAVGDSAALIEGLGQQGQSLLLVRDIEMPRARQMAKADDIGCAADFAPEGGLSGDRDTALAQAVAECLRRNHVQRVTTDRSLPFIFAWHIQQAGISLDYDPELGVMERRIKSGEEIDRLTRAQKQTTEAMTMACRLIARADADADGILMHEGEPLTSEKVRRAITLHLLDHGFSTPHGSIVATLPHVADCHHFGTGPIRTGQPVIVDIFPCDESTHYNGDCTRTVVHGQPSEMVRRMHAAVAEARTTGSQALKPGTTGEQVHKATMRKLMEHGFGFRRGASDIENPEPVMRHGTGHGIGLDVHEPVLLDEGGGEIHAGEVFTVEPGLYSPVHGGVRIEDMVLVTPTGHRVLFPLHDSLDWS